MCIRRTYVHHNNNILSSPNPQKYARFFTRKNQLNQMPEHFRDGRKHASTLNARFLYHGCARGKLIGWLRQLLRKSMRLSALPHFGEEPSQRRRDAGLVLSRANGKPPAPP